MKTVIVIPDGCADDPIPELGGRTPLQAARTPHMDRVAREGVTGLADNVPPTLTPASDVATLSLFGYDPLRVYTGRAPLEAAAMGVRLGPHDWAIRCNLVHAPAGTMDSFTSGHVKSADGAELIRALSPLESVPVPGGRFEFHPGVSYRNLLVYRGDGSANPFAGTSAQAPHDIPSKLLADYLPTGPGRDVLIALMEASKTVIRAHPVTAKRLAAGEQAATQIWLWGLGQAPTIEPFASAYGKRGALVSAVDLVRGVGALLGWARLDVPGATGYLDTDYAAKGRAGVAALTDYDLVCVHVEAPDEASHEGKAREKVLALERIDEHIVGPLLAALPAVGNYRILVEPDHRTTVATKAHAYGAVPFAAMGAGLTPSGAAGYDEVSAAATGLRFDPGWTLMRWLLATPV